MGLFLVPLPTVMHRRAVATLRQRLLVVTAAAGRRPGVVLHNYSMAKQSRQRKDAKQTLDAADDLFQCISSLSAQFSSLGMSAQAERLWAQVHISKSASDQARLYRDLIGTTQTDVVQNDNDPYGDGDQRRLPSESQCQVFRNIWTVGGDLEHLFSPDPTSPSGRGFSPFALACATGNKKLVET